MTSTRFLDNGSPVMTTIVIMKRNTMVKFVNPEKLLADHVLPGALGRIHSQCNGACTVWVLDERTMNTLFVEVPVHLMGQYFRPHAHGIFPHLG